MDTLSGSSAVENAVKVFSLGSGVFARRCSRFSKIVRTLVGRVSGLVVGAR